MSFWEDIELDVNKDDDALEDGYELVNPVVVAEHFVSVDGISIRLGRNLEEWISYLHKKESEKKRKDRELKKLRRKLLADNYGQIKASASSEVHEAFVYKCAAEAGIIADLEALEDEIDGIERAISLATKAITIIKGRFKAVDRNSEHLREYLNFSKLETRVRMHNR